MEYTVSKMTGRFQHLDKSTLETMRLELKMLLKSWGAVGPVVGQFEGSPELPLWMEVEFLDNIVKFEMECNPFLQGETVN